MCYYSNFILYLASTLIVFIKLCSLKLDCRLKEPIGCNTRTIITVISNSNNFNANAEVSDQINKWLDVSSQLSPNQGYLHSDRSSSTSSHPIAFVLAINWGAMSWVKS